MSIQIRISKRKIVSLCFGGFGIILFIIALVAPWYYENVEIDSSEPPIKCTARKLYFLQQFTCHSSDSDCDVICPEDAPDNWRDYCEEGRGDCTDLEDCIDISAIFVGVALFVFLGAFAIVIIVDVIQLGPEKASRAGVLLFGLSGLLLLVPVIYFPAHFPDAYSKSVEGCPDSFSACDSFAGTQVDHNGASTTTTSWGSAGWGVSFAALLFCIANMITSFFSRRELEDIPEMEFFDPHRGTITLVELPVVKPHNIDFDSKHTSLSSFPRRHT